MKWQLPRGIHPLGRVFEEQNYTASLCFLVVALGGFQGVGTLIYFASSPFESRIIVRAAIFAGEIAFSLGLPMCVVFLNCRGKVTAWCLLVFEGAFLIIGIVCTVQGVLLLKSGLFALPPLLLLCAPAALGLLLGLHSLWHSQLALRSLPPSVQRHLLDDNGNTSRYTDNDDNSPEDVHQGDTCLLTDDVDGPLAQAFQAYVQHDALVSNSHPASSPTNLPTNLPDIITAGPSSQGYIQSNTPPQSNLSDDETQKSVISGTADRGAPDQNTTSPSLPTHDADLGQLDYETALAWNAHWSYFHSNFPLWFALPTLFFLGLIHLCTTAYSVRWYEIQGHKMPRLLVFLLIPPSLTILYTITTPLLLLTLRYQSWLLSRIIPGIQIILWAITMYVQLGVMAPGKTCFMAKLLSSIFITVLMACHVFRMDFHSHLGQLVIYDDVGNVISSLRLEDRSSLSDGHRPLELVERENQMIG